MHPREPSAGEPSWLPATTGCHSPSGLGSSGGLWNPLEAPAGVLFGHGFSSPGPSIQLKPWAGLRERGEGKGANSCRTPQNWENTDPREGRTGSPPGQSWEPGFPLSPACPCGTGSWPCCPPGQIPGPSSTHGSGWALTPTPGPQGGGPAHGERSLGRSVGRSVGRRGQRSDRAAAWPGPAPPRPECAPER